MTHFDIILILLFSPIFTYNFYSEKYFIKRAHITHDASGERITHDASGEHITHDAL